LKKDRKSPERNYWRSPALPKRGGARDTKPKKSELKVNAKEGKLATKARGKRMFK